MFSAFAGKVVSEMLLSLYPVFVKNIKVDFSAQMWSRFVAYVAVALFFVDYDFIVRNLFSIWGTILSIVTLFHIYTSYQGFLMLESGTAFTLFYTYPIIILLLAQKISPWLVLLAALGVAFLSYGSPLTGLLMVGGAALTEAFIYFIIKRLPSKNSWNHLFLSYFAGAVLLSLFYTPTQFTGIDLAALSINAFIGMFGYVLRFYSVMRLPVFWYALLSNVGVVSSYVYGYVFNKEIVGVRQIIGSVFLLGACWLAKD